MCQTIHDELGLGWSCFCAALQLCVAWAYKKMAQAGSPLFRIGYFLYCRTRIGYFYYKRELTKAREKHNGGAHSVIEPTTYQGLEIIPIPMSMDNYAYLITCTKTNSSVLVDPADVQSVQPYLEKDRIAPAAVLTTHKHWDHSGGNRHWRSRYPGIRVYGGAMDNVPGATHSIADGDVLEFGQLRFRVMFTPGHTVGHCVYILDGAPFSAPDSIFSGDLLFLSGCGRMFECPPSTMLRSLDAVSGLPPTTLLWPGHEYALDNLEFSCHVQPENQVASEKLAWVRTKRKERLGTIPSTLEEEKEYNPFLRTGDMQLLESLDLTYSDGSDMNNVRAQALLALRERKDKFRYKL